MSILFPRHCMCCGKVLSFSARNQGICDDCKKAVTLVKPPCCQVCGKPLRIPGDALCRDCAAGCHHYIQGKGVFVYAGPMKLAMYRLKYSNHRFVAEICARYAKVKYGEWLSFIQPEAIIPVPMYPRKKRKRGYNQAAVFGKALSRETAIPFVDDLVFRSVDTVPQKGLSLAKRQKNLKNAFKIKENDVKLNCVLIVDDIYTTGATVDAIAKILKRYGVARIYFLTICIGSDG